MCSRFFDVDHESDNFTFTDGDFANKWLPRVSSSLKSLSISSYVCCNSPIVDLPLISTYCQNLVRLKLEFVQLSSMHDMNPMPMLTSLTIGSTILEEEHLHELNKCFPNLQVLDLVEVSGLRDPMIHHLKLKTCYVDLSDKDPPSLTLITPNLVTLGVQCTSLDTLDVEAPMVTRFYLNLKSTVSLTLKKFENLKILWLNSLYIGSLISEFPITTVEKLILDSGGVPPRDATDSKLTLRKVFTVFPNVSSLCIHSGASSGLEACSRLEGWEIFDGRNGLKTICAYLKLVDPSLTFSSMACVLDQCVSLSEVSLLIHGDVGGTISKDFMSKCMARWPGLNWRWGIWSERMEDSWITDGISN